MSEPRTKAGRDLLTDLAYTRDNYLDSILAIEAEAQRSAGAAPLDVATEALERIRQKMSDWQDAAQRAGVYRDGDPDQQMAKWVHDEAAAALRLTEGTDR